MKRYFVIGSSGQLGQSLFKVKPNNVELIITNERLDITDYQKLKDALVKENPDAIINCAAYTYVDKAEDEFEKALSVNAEGLFYLAKVCSSYLDIPVVHISTDYVFDGTGNHTPHSPCNPLNKYGYSKWLGEKLLLKNHKKAIVIRTASVYSEFGNNFIKTLFSRYKDGQREFKVVNDQYSCPTYAPDLAKNIFDRLESEDISYGVYHYCGEKCISWYDFAKQIFEVVDNSVEIKAVTASEFNAKAKRPSNSSLVSDPAYSSSCIKGGIMKSFNNL